MDSAAESYSRGPSESHAARQTAYLPQLFRPSPHADLPGDLSRHPSALVAAHPSRLCGAQAAGAHPVPSANSMGSTAIEPHQQLSQYAPRSAHENACDHRLRTLSAPPLLTAQAQWPRGAQVGLTGGDELGGSTSSYRGSSPHWTPAISPMVITHGEPHAASMPMTSPPPSSHAIPIGAGAVAAIGGYQPTIQHDQIQSTAHAYPQSSTTAFAYHSYHISTSLPPHLTSYVAVNGSPLTALYPELGPGEGHCAPSLSSPSTGYGAFTLPSNPIGSAQSSRWNPESSPGPSAARLSPPHPPHAQAPAPTSSYAFPARPTGASNANPMSLHYSVQPTLYHPNFSQAESDARRPGQYPPTPARPPPTSSSSSTSHGHEPLLGVSRGDALVGDGSRAARETASGQTAFHPSSLQGAYVKRSPSWSMSDHSDEDTSVGENGIKKRRRRRHANEPPRDAATRRFPCPQCGKMFARPSALSTHERSHSKEKPHLCPDPKCKRPFAVPSNLRRHQKVYNHFGPEGVDAKSSSNSSFKSQSGAWQDVDDDPDGAGANDDSNEVVRKSPTRTRRRVERT
ncbi:BQ2448_6776 [Microbotryum intermedium]|uniref:BQ2448_6776 protein n=1 Tax=Microbotryum intermedium TaxID=269621 RepID=A0A238FR43_9BASI|nr:BQ2448_6776 [Microbotryum intermedium]